VKNRLYNNPCTKAKRGGSTLEKSIKVYGNISISGGIEDGRLEKFPINLQYYKIHNNVENNNMKTYEQLLLRVPGLLENTYLIVEKIRSFNNKV